jgi:hypothetical protein
MALAVIIARLEPAARSDRACRMGPAGAHGRHIAVTEGTHCAFQRSETLGRAPA